MRRAGGTLVTLYGRPGCHLCEDARAVLVNVRERFPFTLQEVDIEDDEKLLARYLELIPVVCIDGVEAFRFFVAQGELERRLRLREAQAGQIE
jgi:glutaredoxin